MKRIKKIYLTLVLLSIFALLGVVFVDTMNGQYATALLALIMCASAAILLYIEADFE